MQLTDYVDCLIPRGGAALIQSIRDNATVPVIIDGDGNCHVYVDASADLDERARDRRQRQDAAPERVQRGRVAGRARGGRRRVPPRGRRRARRRRASSSSATTAPAAASPAMGAATDDDFGREFLALKMIGRGRAVARRRDRRTSTGSAPGTPRRSSPATSTPPAASPTRSTPAAVVVNASTRFTDGEEFGFGAEIGISHAEAARARPDGPARAHHLQVRRLGRRPDPRLRPRPHGRTVRSRSTSVDPTRPARERRLPGRHQHRRASCSSPTGSRSRCSSRARPASARPSSPRRVAEVTGARLIRLQCYEGLDESKALYEWNYKKQLLRIQADREHERDWETVESDIFSEPFLLTRPLLEAIRAEEPVVLLIDEVDRVEIETEALLLEVLSDFQVSIPELGTIVGHAAADRVPHVEQHA